MDVHLDPRFCLLLSQWIRLPMLDPWNRNIQMALEDLSESLTETPFEYQVAGVGAVFFIFWLSNAIATALFFTPPPPEEKKRKSSDAAGSSSNNNAKAKTEDDDGGHDQQTDATTTSTSMDAAHPSAAGLSRRGAGRPSGGATDGDWPSLASPTAGERTQEDISKFSYEPEQSQQDQGAPPSSYHEQQQHPPPQHSIPSYPPPPAAGTSNNALHQTNNASTTSLSYPDPPMHSHPQSAAAVPSGPALIFVARQSPSVEVPPVYPLDQRLVSIGRKGNSVNLKLDSTRTPRMISRQHAQITQAPAADGSNRMIWRIVDTNSINGVFVNNAKIKEAVLAHGDIITFGGGASLEVGTIRPNPDAEFVFQFSNPSQQQQQ